MSLVEPEEHPDKVPGSLVGNDGEAISVPPDRSLGRLSSPLHGYQNSIYIYNIYIYIYVLSVYGFIYELALNPEGLFTPSLVRAEPQGERNQDSGRLLLVCIVVGLSSLARACVCVCVCMCVCVCERASACWPFQCDAGILRKSSPLIPWGFLFQA